jgi:hypothetical protein
VLWIIVIAAAALWVIARALPLTCSTSFQGYRTYQGRGGYRSFEWENGEPLFGDDNRGNKWMTIPGQCGDTTINRRSH